MLIVSDVHGKFDEYIRIIRKYEANNPNGYSLQLGDMGFNYDALSVLDSDRHKFFSGNHDNMDVYDDCPHALGDFGVWNNIFYIRGAWSLDQACRTPMFDWWPREQLNYKEMEACYDMYTTVKPSIVVTHDCPHFLLDELFHYDNIKNTDTGILLQQLYLQHQPEVWIFGHHHKTTNLLHGTTLFQCLGELATTEV